MKLRPLFLLSALVLSACGDDEADSQTPPGPVCSYVDTLYPDGRYDPVDALNGCQVAPAGMEPPPEELAEISITLGCDRRLLVETALGSSDDNADNWTFRQPAACYGAVQCGYVAVEFDFDPYAVAPPLPCDPAAWVEPSEDSDWFPDPSVSSCGESALGSTIVDLNRIANPEGVHWLRSWLMNWDHTPFGHAVDVPVSITLAECPALPDGEAPPDGEVPPDDASE